MRAFICSFVCAGLAFATQAATVQVTSPPRAVEPGDLALHVFRVANPLDAPLEIGLSLELPQGWSALPISPRITLDPEEAETVFVTAQVPPGAEAGEYAVGLVARWDGQQAAATAEVTVRQVAEVAVEAPQGKGVPPGETAVYTFLVTNRGNTVDRYTLAADSARRYSLRVDPPELSLAPMERGTVTVEVGVPPTAAAGRDRLLLVIQSTAAPALRREVTLFTTVLPPHPELIVGHTRAEVDARLGGELEYDLVTDYRHSSLSFSGRTSLLGGVLSFGLQTSGPWGDPPLGVDRARLEYTHDQTRLRAGELSMTLAPLSGLSGSGVAVDLFQGRGSLSLLSDWHEGEGMFGGTVTVLGNTWELGTAYRETRDAEEHLRALAGRISHFLGEHVEFKLAACLARDSAFQDEGLQAALRVEVDQVVILHLAWHSVGAIIPSPLADEEGMSISGRFAAAPLAFRFASRWVRNNPHRLAPGGSPSRIELSSSLDWAPEDWPMAFWGGFSGRREWDGAGEEVERIQEAQLALSGGEAPLTFRLWGSLRIDEEVPNGHTFLRTAYNQQFTLTGDLLVCTLSLGQKAVFDHPGNALVEGGWEVALSARLVDAPHSLSLNWRHEGPDVTAELELEGPLAEDFGAGFVAAADWDDGGDVASLRLGFVFQHSFLWAPPFLPARGWLEGRVLAEDVPVEGAVLAAAGLKVATDAEGVFLFPPLEPGPYAVAIDRLPPAVRALDPEPVEAVVKLDERTHIVIRCERLAEVRGLVFDDRDQEGERHPDDPGLAGITVALLEDAEPVESTTTGSAGRFSFSRLSPGNYTVRLRTDSLPARFEPTTPTELKVELDPGAVVEVEFGAWQRPREVVIAPTPPLADFEWEPSVPQAGESVAFDAGLSAAGDAEIVAYRWDFTDDGETDATGREASWTFAEPGVYWIELTVEDALGFEDELTLPIEVTPAD